MARKWRRKRSQKLVDAEPVALYKCLGCDREWGENLAELGRMRDSGQIDSYHSGTGCPCGHPYIKWLNYDELAPKLRTCTGRNDEGP